LPVVLSNVPIALFAGRGDLPHTLIQIFQKQKRPFVILAFQGQTEKSLVEHLPHIWLHFGEIGKALRYMDENHIKEIVMAGAISRPVLSEIRPDWEGVKWLAKIGSKALGDDNLLKLVIGMIEKKGYTVVGPDDVLEDILAPLGPLTSLEPDEQAWRDIGRGIEILCALSPVDVGQAVVVQEGLVLGIEAIEGTDALIERVGPLHRPGGLGGILIKVAKSQQEQRVDLPTIGETTILKVLQAGLRGIAIEAGRTLFLNREKTLKLAQEKGLFIIGLTSTQCRTFL
jgi:UDP-2,3-diacylglucosamine hydrolase